MGAVPINELSSVSLARSWNASSQWPDRQVADKPRPAINAFFPQLSDAGLIPLLAQEIAVQPSADICSRNQPAEADESDFINPGRWDRS
jgi:hypothetical protein